jgi:hypothetical protein
MEGTIMVVDIIMEATILAVGITAILAVAIVECISAQLK